jgi:hypothetical protein
MTLLIGLVQNYKHNMYNQLNIFLIDIVFGRCTEARRTKRHTQDHTQYRRFTVKEHDHHWDSVRF